MPCYSFFSILANRNQIVLKGNADGFCGRLSIGRLVNVLGSTAEVKLAGVSTRLL